MVRTGDDQRGIRVVAERSALADDLKDSGSVSLFPQLANPWKTQVVAQEGWKNFKLADFPKLSRVLRSWVIVLQRSNSYRHPDCR